MLLRRLRQENDLNAGGRGCGELRSCHFTPAWATRVKLHLKKKKSRLLNQPIWVQILVLPLTSHVTLGKPIGNESDNGMNNDNTNHEFLRGLKDNFFERKRW